jgi:Sec-independent protein translocase protein TatA
MIVSAMDIFGVQELVVLFLVGLLLFGPKDPRQLADVITKATQEFQKGDQRWQLRERTVRDSTILAVVFLAACVVLCWVLIRL